MPAPGSSVRFEAVVVGVSSGGVELLNRLVPALPADFPLPIVVCLHIGHDAESLATLLGTRAALRVKEAESLEPLAGGTVYLAPAGYHLLIEPDHSFSLSTDPPVKYARPSIDVLFESAADAYAERLIGVILTGASEDGAAGLARVKARGGYAIVQDPATALAPVMPAAAIRAAAPDEVLAPPDLVPCLQRLAAG